MPFDLVKAALVNSHHTFEDSLSRTLRSGNFPQAPSKSRSCAERMAPYATKKQSNAPYYNVWVSLPAQKPATYSRQASQKVPFLDCPPNQSHIALLPNLFRWPKHLHHSRSPLRIAARHQVCHEDSLPDLGFLENDPEGLRKSYLIIPGGKVVKQEVKRVGQAVTWGVWRVSYSMKGFDSGTRKTLVKAQ